MKATQKQRDELNDSIAQARAEYAAERATRAPARPGLSVLEVLARAAKLRPMVKLPRRKHVPPWQRPYLQGDNDRFVVTSVTGYSMYDRDEDPHTVYAVLDRGNCHHIVREFRLVGKRDSAGSKRQAEALANQLNDEHGPLFQ